MMTMNYQFTTLTPRALFCLFLICLGSNCYGCTHFGEGFVAMFHKLGRSMFYDEGSPNGDEHGHGCTVHMIRNSDMRKVYAQPFSGDINGLGRFIRWRLPAPTWATIHIQRGNTSAPFSGATFVLFGSQYRPKLDPEVGTLRILTPAQAAAAPAQP